MRKLIPIFFIFSFVIVSLTSCYKDCTCLDMSSGEATTFNNVPDSQCDLMNDSYKDLETTIICN